MYGRMYLDIDVTPKQNLSYPDQLTPIVSNKTQQQLLDKARWSLIVHRYTILMYFVLYQIESIHFVITQLL